MFTSKCVDNTKERDTAKWCAPNLDLSKEFYTLQTGLVEFFQEIPHLTSEDVNTLGKIGY